jgi:putative MATE family efflux protein
LKNSLKAEKTSDKLGTEPIGSLLLKQSVPAAMGFLVMSLYQIVDTFFVSKFVGPLAIGAITVVLPITFLISSMGMAIGIGGSSVISRALGNEDEKKAQLAFGNMITMAVVFLGVFLVAGYVFQEELLALFGANKEIMPFAKEYFNILLIGLPFLGWAMLSNNVIRAEGKPKVAMLTLVIPAVANMVLDPIFIYYMDLGIAGAAYATTIGYICSGLYTLWFFLVGRSELSLIKENLALDWDIVIEVSSIGSVTLLRQGMFSLMAIVLNNSLDKYGQIEYASTFGESGGSHAIAIYGLIRAFTLFVAFPIIGIMQGLMPIVAFNYGAKKWDRVKSSIMLSIKWTTVTSIILYGLIAIFADPLINSFTQEQALIDHTPRVLKLIFLSLPLMGVGFIGGAYFQAVGKTGPALFLTLARQGLFMIPLMYILPRFMVLDGVWVSMPIGEVLAGIVAGIWLYLEMKNLKNGGKMDAEVATA